MILLVVVGTVTLIQLVYLSLYVYAFQKKVKAEITPPAPVSVVVCAHDEEQNLRALVPLLLAQQYPNFEVVIVNDRSNDGTYDYLLEETKTNAKLRMVNVDRLPGHVNAKKYALTLGIKAASHEWILLTDADCLPENDRWIEMMSQHFGDQTDFVLGISPYQKKKGILNLFIRFDSLVTIIQYISFALLGKPYMGVGRNLAYRKSLFMAKKGFNQFSAVVGGDDDIFVNQHARGEATQVAIVQGCHMTSIPKQSFKSFFWQKVRHLSVGKYYSKSDQVVLGTFMATWMLTWLLGVIALLVLPMPLKVYATGAMLLRIIMLAMAFRTMLRQTGITFPVVAVPFLDFLYPIYYISTGLVALLTKKIQWRN